MIKINFDGDRSGNPGSSGIGFIVRNCDGDTLAFGTQKLPPRTNNVAKGNASLLTINFGISYGFKWVHLEGDSVIIVKTIEKCNILSWHLQQVIDSIVDKLH